MNNVISQYNNALRWGTMDPAEIDTFNADLEAAGINEIVAEKQRQLDEFLATKGDSAEDGDTSEVAIPLRMAILPKFLLRLLWFPLRLPSKLLPNS